MIKKIDQIKTYLHLYFGLQNKGGGKFKIDQILINFKLTSILILGPKIKMEVSPAAPERRDYLHFGARSKSAP